MEFGSKEAFGCLMAMLLAPAAWGADVGVRHDHWHGGCEGVLRVSDEGVAFESAKQKKHSWKWTWDDIEQLTAGDKSIRVTTYKDRVLRLGAAEEETFLLPEGVRADDAVLREHLGGKFVQAEGEKSRGVEIPAKLLGALHRPQGVLVLAGDRVVFQTASPDRGRTWLLADIENVSRLGPYSLLVVTGEGGGREFRFQLKRPLPETEYEALWQRLNQSKGLRILRSYQEKEEK